MQSQGEATRTFKDQEIEYLERTQRLVKLVPYELDSKVVRCHELARAIAKLLGLTFEDGYYGMVEHSWVWTRPREPFEPPSNILDPYTPGRLPQVQLVHSSTMLPFEYRRGDPRKDIDQEMVDSLVQIFEESQRVIRCLNGDVFQVPNHWNCHQ